METEEKINPVLNRILDEIKNAKNSDSMTTAHNVYVSGVFEESSKDEDAKPN